jgi:hypothetical protein
MALDRIPKERAVWDIGWRKEIIFGALAKQNCEKRFFLSFCLSLHPHGTTGFLLNGFSRLYIGSFY